MTFPPLTNYTISIWRFVRNAGTGKSTLTELYTNVPAFINSDEPQMAGPMSTEIPVRIMVDWAVDLINGDQITGYSPLGIANPPTIQVNNVDKFPLPPGSANSGIRTGYLKQLGPNNA